MCREWETFIYDLLLKIKEPMTLFVKKKSLLEPPSLQQILVLLPKYVYLKSHKSFMSFLAIQLHHSPSQNMNTTIYLAHIPSPLRLSLRRIIIFCYILAVDKKLVLDTGSNKDKAR